MNERKVNVNREHAGSGDRLPPAEELAGPAFEFVNGQRIGTLSTMSVKHPGYPYGSLCPYALEDRGQPIFLMSSMAVHAKNLRADAHVSLLVVDPAAQQNPLGTGRATLIGDVVMVNDDERDAVTAPYLERHPESAQWAHFGDFQFYRLVLRDIYYVGRFGVMGWISPRQFENAGS